MKISLLCAALASTLLAGCIIAPPEPPVVSVSSGPYYSPGYVVTTLPTGYRTVYYRHRTYYSNGNVYYARHPHGYVVVTRPY